MICGRDWVFTLFTNDARLATAAAAAGIERIGLDLEKFGKLDRQKGLGTRLSEHSIGEAAAVYAGIPAEGRFARINPVNADSKDEIEQIIAAGAKVLMLPYFHSVGEVEFFVNAVAGRAKTIGLAETLGSLAAIPEIVRPGLLNEVHFGFTDLGIAMRKDHWGVLRDQRLIAAAEILRDLKMPFGVAGFARPADKSLPFPPSAFIGAVAGLGASRALISRSFLRPVLKQDELAKDLADLRAFLDRLSDAASSSQLQKGVSAGAQSG
jgi:hypothetical protein